MTYRWIRKLGIKLMATVLAAGVVTLSGCAETVIGLGAAGAATAGALYYKGSVEKVYDLPLERCYEACIRAVKKEKLPILKRTLDRTSGKIIARDANGRKVTVLLEPATSESTRVKIRVGTFGDAATGQRIFDEIDKVLGRR